MHRSDLNLSIGAILSHRTTIFVLSFNVWLQFSSTTKETIENSWKLIAVYNGMLFSMPKFNFFLVCYTFHRKRPAFFVFFSSFIFFFIFTIFNFIMHFSLHAFHSSWYIFKIWYFEDMRFDRSKCGSSNDSNSVLFTWFCIVCVLFRITTVRNCIFVEIKFLR